MGKSTTTPQEAITAQVGKRVAGRVYLHREFIWTLPDDELRRIEQGDRLAGSPDWNVLKVYPTRDRLSLLCYEQFFDVPFPQLAASFSIDLNTQNVELTRYPPGRNRPVLHRKELLIAPEHPRWSEYSALTRSLDEAGLFEDAHRIGYRDQWNSRLCARGFRVNGHQLERMMDSTNLSSEIARHRTALTRYAFSTPMQALARHGYLDGSKSVFDYGCGKGDDLRLLNMNEVPAAGWDPYYRPDATKTSASVVNLGFVINVIEKPDERIAVLHEAFRLADHILVASVMLEGVTNNGGQSYRDGVLTNRNTFQRYYTQAEFGNFLSSVLEVDPIPVGPGIFFVFKNVVDAEEFLERRSANRSHILQLTQRLPRVSSGERAEQLYEANSNLLNSIWSKYLSLGRPPTEYEAPQLANLKSIFGSVKRGLGFLAKYHGSNLIAEAAESRKSDLRVYLALQVFSPRKRFSTYPERLRTDIKVFLGSLAKARMEAHALLYSVGSPEHIHTDCIASAEQRIGRLSQDGRALMIHSSHVERLSERLRVYVGCASSFYGDPSSCDLIKIHIESGKLSLLTYDDFEGSPLPRLKQRVKLNFRNQGIQIFEYDETHEASLLFEKSKYIDENFPNYEDQLNFDQQLSALSTLEFRGHGPALPDFRRGLRAARKAVQGFSLTDVGDIPDLDEPCGRYLSFRQLIECGETQHKTNISNIPRQPSTYNAIARLCSTVIAPVMDYFGAIELTYGFCGPALARQIPGGIDPARDQHASHEINTRGKRICSRQGAAVDFIIRDENMAEVARWIFENCPFDRIYFYGPDRPLHVSVGPDNKQQVTFLQEHNERRIPRCIREPIDFFSSFC